MTTLTVSSSEFRRNMPSIVGKAEATLQEIEARRKDPDAPIYHDINDLFADLGI